MPAKPLNQDQLADAERLSALINASQKSQELIAAECGWKTQATVSQYARGKIPLNLEAAVKFAIALDCKIEQFSEKWASVLGPLHRVVSPNFKPPQNIDQKLSRETNRLIERLKSLDAGGGSTPQFYRAIDAMLDVVSPRNSAKPYSGLDNLTEE